MANSGVKKRRERKDPTVEKIFIYKMRTRGEALDFKKFQEMAIFDGLTPIEYLDRLVAQEIEKRGLAFEVGIEPVLVERLKSVNGPASRITIRKWRELGYLDGTFGGEKFWSTDGSTVLYNIPAMIKYTKMRRGDPSLRVLRGQDMHPLTGEVTGEPIGQPDDRQTIEGSSGGGSAKPAGRPRGRPRKSAPLEETVSPS